MKVMDTQQKFGFKNITLDVRTSDGLDDILLEGLYYTAKDGSQYCSPIGSGTDGFSVPRCVQNIIPPTGGSWFAAVQHDASYRGTLQILNAAGAWEVANLTQEQCDNLILEALESQGVGIVERELIYRALRLFGHVAFNEDRGIK